MIARFLISLMLGATSLSAIASNFANANDQRSSNSETTIAPVLVELFTSEGCSSCPPADQLLQELDRSQPSDGATVVVLSEHVDYWNHIGWRDRFSSPLFSERQSAYARQFGLNSVYTPQMVVDGAIEFVGNDSGSARAAITKEARMPKVPISISNIQLQNDKSMSIQVEIASAPQFRGTKAEVFVVLADNRAQTEVLRGENSGRKLSHVAVVREIRPIAVWSAESTLSEQVHLQLQKNWDPKNMRLIAFMQERSYGRVLGVVMKKLEGNISEARVVPLGPISPYQFCAVTSVGAPAMLAESLEAGFSKQKGLFDVLSPRGLQE